MTMPTPTSDPRITRQFLYAATAEGLLLAGIALFFIVEPQTVLTITLAAIAFALGAIAAVWAIYKAVPLMTEPQTRTVGYLTIALVIGGPILLFAVSQFI